MNSLSEVQRRFFSSDLRLRRMIGGGLVGTLNRCNCYPRPANKLRYVQGVSWPRSGHGLLVNSLGSFFGFHNDFFRYCEYYHCCNSIPCVDPLTRFAKNHDYEGCVPKRSGMPYIVQIRHQVPSIISNYCLHLDWKRTRGEAPHEWRQFAFNQIEHWRSFARKWILDEQTPETLVLPYEDFLQRPFLQFSRALRHFGCTNASSLRIWAVLLCRDISLHRRIEYFEHYDPATIDEMEDRASPYLSALGYTSCLRSEPPYRTL